MQCNGHFHSGTWCRQRGHCLFDICLNGGGEKEDLAWMQVMAISSKMWLKSLILFMSVTWRGAFEGYFTCIWDLFTWNLFKFLLGNIVFRESMNYMLFQSGGKEILMMKPACRRAGVASRAGVTQPHRLTLLSGAAKGHAMLYTGQWAPGQVVQCCNAGPAPVLLPLPAMWITIISLLLPDFFGGSLVLRDS